ncbi:MAG: hypothetical protein BWY91_02952 [bacterium ADurb.BinA028]|nr:MAG: hypothetical protein BWY91_02952 [bacterium ADurb.BinA028]
MGGLAAVGVADDDVAVRHHEDSCGHQHDAEGPIHHPASADPVGHPATEGPQERGREDERRGEQGRRPDLDAEVVDVVLRQPRREGDVGTEDGHVVEAEPPDPHLLEGREHLAHGLGGPGHPVAPRDDDVGEDGQHHQQHRVDDRHEPPPALEPEGEGATGGPEDDRGADELRDGGPHVAGPEYAEREALPLPAVPRGVPRDADREEVAGEADKERQDKEHAVAARRRDEIGRDRGRREHEDGDLAATDAVGEHPGRQAPHRPVEHGHRRDPGQFDVGEAELLLDRGAEDAEHQPHREHRGEGCRGHDQDSGRTATGVVDGGNRLSRESAQVLHVDHFLGGSSKLRRAVRLTTQKNATPGANPPNTPPVLQTTSR